MKITREVLILRKVISLPESLRPAQRERCLNEIYGRFRTIGRDPFLPPELLGLPRDKEAEHGA